MEWETTTSVERRKPIQDGRFAGFPGQRVGRFRAHNPRVAGSNPAPATKRTFGIPTFSRSFSRPELAGDPRVKHDRPGSTSHSS